MPIHSQTPWWGGNSTQSTLGDGKYFCKHISSSWGLHGHMCGTKVPPGPKPGAARRQREQPARGSGIGGEGAYPHVSRAVRIKQISASGGGQGAGGCSPPHRAASAHELKALASNLLIYPEFFSLIVFIVGAIWMG